jgi:hypothetical protein
MERGEERMTKGEENLIPFDDRTEEEQRQIRKSGGVASGEARRRKRDIRLAMEALLEKQYKGKDGKELSGAEAIALKQMEKALKGDAKAFELVRDTAGQKPVEKVEQVNIDMEYDQSVKYVEELMKRRNEESD